jgi:hypothetical protein
VRALFLPLAAISQTQVQVEALRESKRQLLALQQQHAAEVCAEQARFFGAFSIFFLKQDPSS